MRVRINAYNPGSATARALSEAIGTQIRGNRCMILRRNTQYRQRDGDVVINLGIPAAELPVRNGVQVLNKTTAVRTATNKRTFFETIARHNRGAEDGYEISIPEFTTDIDEAKSWLREDGGALRLSNQVVCRTVLNGHSAEGLIIAKSEQEVVPAPLYTRYIPKQHEYRVHVVKGVVVDVQKKARRLEVPVVEVNWQVRNLAGGFIYKREGVTLESVPTEVRVQSIRVVEALGLDFGAVDVIYNERGGKCYVLEVNTCPGMEGSTVDKYSDAIVRHVLGEPIQPWEGNEPEGEPEQEEQAPVAPEPVRQEPVVNMEDVALVENAIAEGDIHRDAIRQRRELMAQLVALDRRRDESRRTLNSLLEELIPVRNRYLIDGVRETGNTPEALQRLRDIVRAGLVPQNAQAEAPRREVNHPELQITL